MTFKTFKQVETCIQCYYKMHTYITNSFMTMSSVPVTDSLLEIMFALSKFHINVYKHLNYSSYTNSVS